jgi:hypothetical protein
MGTSTARSNYSSITPQFQYEYGTNNNARGFAITYNDTSTTGPVVFLGKTKGATVGSNTLVASGDELGQITFNGSDGTNMLQGAAIVAAVDGTPGANDMPGRLVFSTTADGASSPTERMRINSSGQVLINTSSALPLTPALSVYALNIETFVGGGLLNHCIGMTRHGGTVPEAGQRMTFARSRGTTAGSVTLVANGDQLGAIDFAGADGTDFGTSAASITCEVDGTPGANDMPGRLVFATTPDGSNSPVERMRIDNGGAVTISSSRPGTGVVAIDNSSNTNGTQALGLLNRANANNTSSYYLVCQEPFVANRCFIYGNGNLANSNNSYGAISDIKLKENIADAASQWSDLKALQVRNYNFKEETGQQTHRQIGLIAQEVELVSPGLVYESPDRDTEGNDLGTVTKSVNYSVLYMKAVKALQEAMERIETLEASNADLLSRVAALEPG